MSPERAFNCPLAAPVASSETALIRRAAAPRDVHRDLTEAVRHVGVAASRASPGLGPARADNNADVGAARRMPRRSRHPTTPERAVGHTVRGGATTT